MHQRDRRVPLAGQGRLGRDHVVRAIGRDEVDQRRLVFEVEVEVNPAVVGRQGGVGRRRVEQPPSRVQARGAGVTRTRYVECWKVEGQPQQLVTHRLGDEFIDLVANLPGHSTDDVARHLLRSLAPSYERRRVQERVQQGDIPTSAGRADPVDGLVQHRVPETVYRVGELTADRRVDAGVVSGTALAEEIHHRLDLASELLEGQMLVLHFGHEPGRLEQALAVPLSVGALPIGKREHRVSGTRCRIVPNDGLEVALVIGVGLVVQPVVLGVEDVVHRGQSDVLIDSSVSGEEVDTEHLVVVGRRVIVVRCARVGVGGQRAPRQRAVAIGVTDGNGGVRDVVEERGARRHGVRRGDRSERVALDQHVAGLDHLRVAVGTAGELSVGVGRQERNAEDVRVGEGDTQLGERLCLHGGPISHAAPRAGDQLAGCLGLARSVVRVVAQEDLVRRVRAVGLALVDERGRLVDDISGPVGRRAGQHHEVGAIVGVAGDIVRAVIEQGVVRLERNEDAAPTALAGQVEAMVEELAE